MEALEYEKARIRMCRTMIIKEGGCSACPLYDKLKLRCMIPASVFQKTDEDAIKKNIDEVIKWAKDHPVKTRQSEFLKMFPHAQKRDGIINICPLSVDKDHKTNSECLKTNCGGCRQRFWNEEVSE